ncbi:hypothetical protein [Photobacterium ganghwense]|uniref:hypothetical protein n=1 Tax=Photobacterium ganghwense TaxID=320778 RepID=UPI0039EE63E8
MTMIVGIHLGDYVIIAADRREVFIDGGKVSSVISDEVDKFVKWNGGIITGCGYVPLLSELKKHLKHTEITSTNQIVALTKRVVSDLPINASIWRQQTHWMFSYISGSEVGPQCRLGYIRSEVPDEIHLLYTMRATIWAKLPDIEQRIDTLNAALKPLSRTYDFEENVAYHLGLLKELFLYASTVDETVSKDFNYYIQAYNGDERLSSQAHGRVTG